MQEHARPKLERAYNVGTAAPGFLEARRQRREDARQAAPRGYVYFVTGDHPDAVKIGFTENLTERLRGLQTGMAGEIMLAACIRGTMLDERDLHEEFRGQRLRGEWFTLSGPVLERIDRLRATRECSDLILAHQTWQWTHLR